MVCAVPLHRTSIPIRDVQKEVFRLCVENGVISEWYIGTTAESSCGILVKMLKIKLTPPASKIKDNHVQQTQKANQDAPKCLRCFYTDMKDKKRSNFIERNSSTNDIDISVPYCSILFLGNQYFFRTEE